MGPRFLIDTNILIYVFARQMPSDMAERMTSIFQESFIISAINKMEFLGWKEASDSEMEQARNFISNAVVLPIDDAVVEKTIALKRKMKIKLPDAIVAATCLTHNLVLLTRNIGDFDRIGRLTVLNPFMSP